MISNKLISIVIPMYFEELVVNECYKRLNPVLESIKYDYELIFVNDGSTDKTLELLRELGEKDNHIKIVNLSRNFGHQIAVTAGIDKAKGNAIIIMDADLQDPPELIPMMLDKWECGFDVVYAKRKRRKGETWFKLFTAKTFYRVLDNLTDIRIPLDTGDFRLIDRKISRELSIMKEKNRFLRGMVAWIGYKQGSIEYEREERFAGDSKYPLRKMIKFALDGIFSFSTKPLKYVERIGIISVLVSLYIFLSSFISKIRGNGHLVDGWTSLICVITFLGGVQLLSIGILGEYIGRTYEESKNRPLYIVDEDNSLRID
jgi:glycosyltransferase involved in cell wall biosynthesis